MPGKIKRTKRQKDAKDKKRWGFTLGVVIIIFALIGVATVIILAVGGLSRLADNSEKFIEYEQYLSAVVMNDPDPFDDINQAKMPQLLDATIWALMRSDLDPDAYEYSEGETAGLIVPQADVEEQFRLLFGEEIKPVHATVDGGTYSFTYDETRQAYIVPLTGVMPTFIPRVLSQERRGDSVILTVGYISGDGWEQDERGSYIEPAPSKYMRITLRMRGDGYFISALQNSDAPETAVATTQRSSDTTQQTQAQQSADAAQSGE